MASDPAATDWRFVHGRAAPPELPRRLAAGAFAADLVGLDLLDIRFGAVEVLRRLAVRVRDEAWGTVAPVAWTTEVDETAGGLAVRFAARHRGPQIDFAWEGEAVADPAGTLTFAIAGRALAPSRFNRVGIVLLHPLTIAGRRYRAEAAGRADAGDLPDLVGPQAMEAGVELPLFPAFDRLEIDTAEGPTLDFRFEGDLFEMEDQRNWSDGSFKTYSTPLALPIPRVLRAGETLVQKLTLRVRQRPGAPAAAPRGEGPVAIALAGPGEAVLAPVGVMLDGDGDVPGEAALALVRRLAPAHLHAELDLGDGAALARAGRIAAAIGAPLALALSVPPAMTDVAAGLAALAPDLAALPVARLALLPEDGRPTPQAWIDQAARTVAGVPLVHGTRSDFMELNRVRTALAGADGLVFAMSPEVHDEDIAALAQSLDGQPDMVRTARAFAPAAAIHIAPLTLRPRRLRKPGAPLLPEEIDDRQAALLVAAFAVGSLAGLSEAGAASLTLFAMTGPAGLVPREGGAPTAAFHALEAAGRWRGRRLVRAAADAPSRVRALLVDDGGAVAGLVVSLAPVPTAVILTGLPAGRYRLSRLGPDGFGAGQGVTATGGTLRVMLGPCDVVHIDAG